MLLVPVSEGGVGNFMLIQLLSSDGLGRGLAELGNNFDEVKTQLYWGCFAKVVVVVDVYVYGICG